MTRLALHFALHPYPKLYQHTLAEVQNPDGLTEHL